MKKGAIYKNIDKANKATEIVTKFDKFCATPRAEKLVIDVDKLGIEDLLKKYDLQYLKKLRPMNSESTIRAFIRMKSYNNGINHDYTHIHNKRFIRRKDINFNLPWNLTKEEIKAIWDKKKNVKLGYADRLHRLHTHKMDKWDRLHKPTYKELKEFLFPNMLIAEYYDKREKKSIDLNEDLSTRYLPNYSNIVTARYYRDEDTIVEEVFGCIKDPNGTLEKRPSFYTVRNKDEYIWKQACKMKESAKFVYKDNFICLKVFCKDKYRVAMWI